MMKAIWITIIIVSALIEYFTVDLVSIWFTAGAIFALICELFGLSMIWQVAIFIVISSALIILSQPLVKRYMRVEKNDHVEVLAIEGAHLIVKKI